MNFLNAPRIRHIRENKKLKQKAFAQWQSIIW